MSENRCSQCGSTNAVHAKFCGTCGAPLEAAPTPPQPNYAGTPPGQEQSSSTPPASNKALFSLILGIMSFMCCGPFTGIPGAILGKMEMDAIKEGRAPASNLGMAKAGFWISLAGAVLSILMFIMALSLGILANLPFLK